MNIPADPQPPELRPRRRTRTIVWAGGAALLAVLILFVVPATQQARTDAIRSADK
ncbi:MAG TPA: hypothetical protein VMP01_24570 [Pirellulaceae bacterium]|nr:hypothetical protein [Pirellulaceae bacterium]